MRRAACASVLAAAIALAPSHARAQGSGSGGAAFWNGVLVVGAVGAAAMIAIPLVYDVSRASRNLAPEQDWATAQIVGGGVATALMGALSYDVLARGHAKKNHWILPAATGFVAGYLGYGIGGSLDRDSARGSAIGVVTALSAVSGARATLTVAGLPRDRGTGIVQAILAAPAIAAAPYWATDEQRTQGRALLWGLAGASTAFAIHGIVDAIVYEPPKEPLGCGAQPDATCASWTIAPAAVPALGGAAPGIAVAGSM